MTVVVRDFKMNISPVSFGKIYKVNGSIEAKNRAVALINSKKPAPIEEETAQRQLKKVFNDVKEGSAQLVTINGYDTYILTGQDSEEVSALRCDMLNALDRASQYYGQGDLFDIEFDVQSDYYVSQLENLIRENVGDEEINLNFNKATSQINSINLKA